MKVIDSLFKFITPYLDRIDKIIGGTISLRRVILDRGAVVTTGGTAGGAWILTTEEGMTQQACFDFEAPGRIYIRTRTRDTADADWGGGVVGRRLPANPLKGVTA